MNRHFGKLILMITAMCALATGQQQPAGTTTNLPQARQSPLTDRDVIQMVESGKTEAAIVTSIRSSRTNFDLSPQGCRLLVAAHVNRTILNAMGSGGQPPCASSSESSKPETSGTGALLGNGNSTLLGDGSVHAPSGAKSGTGSPGANVAQATTAVSDYRQPSGTRGSALPAAFTGGVKVVAGKKVTIALATNSSIIAVFRQQKQAGNLQPGQTMAAGSMSPIGAEPSNVKLKAVPVYIPSSLLTPQENALCQQREAQNLAPEIFRVSGKPKGQGIVYSPDPQTNPYIVVGCGFGNTAGNAVLGFFSDAGKGVGAPTQKRALNIQTWSDHEIVASLDQNTSGLPDWDAVRLLVAAQKTTESAEGTFYARRQTVQLPNIPLNQASLYQQGSPYFLSPVSNYYGLNGTVAVMRQGLPGPMAGQDQFTLQLPRGFVVESTQTDLLVSNTSANVTSKPASINGNTITVTYPVLSYGSGTTAGYYSIYGLTIWVTGPAGVTP